MGKALTAPSYIIGSFDTQLRYRLSDHKETEIGLNAIT